MHQDVSDTRGLSLPPPIGRYENNLDWDGMLIGPKPFEDYLQNASNDANGEDHPDNGSVGASASQESRRSEDTENPHRSSRWGGWGFTEAYCEDWRRHNHYDEDGDTVEHSIASVRSDPPTPRRDMPERSTLTFEQTTAPSASNNADVERRNRYLTMSARRRAHYDKHHLPPSQCRLEDLEFDFHSCHSEDTGTSEFSPPNPEVSTYQVTATDRDDFHDEEWGTIEFADERPFKGHDEGISEDEDEGGIDTKNNKPDFHRGD